MAGSDNASANTSRDGEKSNSSVGGGLPPELIGSLIAFGLGWLLRGSGRPSATVPARARRSDPAPSVATTSAAVLRVAGAEVFDGKGVLACEREERAVGQVVAAALEHRAAVQRLEALKEADDAAVSGLRDGGASPASAARAAVDGGLSWSEQVSALLARERPARQRPSRWCRTPDDFVELLLRACVFVAERHKNQRRKDAERTPYVNHALEVAYTLWRDGGIRDGRLILAGLLCHTLSDGDVADEVGEWECAAAATAEPARLSKPHRDPYLLEIEKEFGMEVCAIVRECWAEKRAVTRLMRGQAHLSVQDDSEAVRAREERPVTGKARAASRWWSFGLGGQTAAEEVDTAHCLTFGGGGRAHGVRQHAGVKLTRMDRKRIEAACSILKSKEAKIVRLADKLVNLREMLGCASGCPPGWTAQRVDEYFAWADATRGKIGKACPPLDRALVKVIAQRAKEAVAQVDAASVDGLLQDQLPEEEGKENVMATPKKAVKQVGVNGARDVAVDVSVMSQVSSTPTRKVTFADDALHRLF
ncbi:hypothetical protein CDCA_CDCA01G0002 [Cyanidium caldarium]|uniref:HD domain-containing protein n=1 Tax=Cyanidium caldarium TaxID=2771 RepID=A0AAV9INY9_CYACA|nr:hypothetical protein CDCA_CDCA01G0002 [Cyanidium caldarium]